MDSKRGIFFQSVCFLCAFLLRVCFSGGTVFAEEIVFSQKLLWNEEPNALSYKVEIENTGDDSIKKTIETEQTFVEFSMEPGDYRYRVFAYDFLGREASVTEWKPFSIIKALKPNVYVSDREMKIDRASSSEIPVSVESISKESTATLVNEETGETLPGTVVVTENDEMSASGIVKVEGLTEGTWKVVVKNPGGLSTESESFSAVPKGKSLIVGKNVERGEQLSEQVPELVPEVAEAVPESEPSEEEEKTEPEKKKEKKPYSPFDVNILAGAIIPFVFYDEYLKSFDGKNFNYGFTAKISYFPFDIHSFQIGFEAGVDLTELSIRNDYIEVQFPLWLPHIDAVWRIRFFHEKFGVNVKLGAGAAFIGKNISYYESALRENPAHQYYCFVTANAGVSFSWIPFRHLILEAGVDFANIFIPDMISGIMDVYLCVGFRF